MVYPVSNQFEQTIKSELELIGTMALSGRASRICIKPAEVGTGIQFLRTDKPEDRALVKADWQQIADIKCNYSLRNEHDVLVHRVDNLLAALHCCGIDNALIEIEGSEVPFIHKQPVKFLNVIRKTGIIQQAKEKQVILVNKKVEVKVNGIYATLMPASTSRISFNDLSQEQNSKQIFSFLHPRLASRARASLQYLQQLKSINDNKVISPNHIHEIINPRDLPGITIPTQCKSDTVNRNGIVSILSTMALTGMTLIGHLYTNKPNNEVLHLLIGTLFNQTKNWRQLSYADFHDISHEPFGEAN
jgi:UDP-3-O-[3-hydroxymyristoyl] N-acetylglucosamine deacetylase